jgi:hypothetical protein
MQVDYVDMEGATMLSVPGYAEKIEFGGIWSFAYPLEDGSGEIVVATTRPETLLGDTAVAVHPEDPRYASFHGKFVVHPFNGRKLPIIQVRQMIHGSSRRIHKLAHGVMQQCVATALERSRSRRLAYMRSRISERLCADVCHSGLGFTAAITLLVKYRRPRKWRWKPIQPDSAVSHSARLAHAQLDEHALT